MINVGFEKIQPTPELPIEFDGVSFSGVKWSSRRRIVTEFKTYIKATLRVRQLGRCCYCRRQLSDDISVDIEHFLEKTSVPELAFEIMNLALSCKSCNTYKNTSFSLLSMRVKRILKKRRLQHSFKQCPSILGQYNQVIGIGEQRYRWVHPHFHIYSEHIKIHCGWIYESKSKVGSRTISGLNLNGIGQVELRALRERILVRDSLAAKIVKTLILEDSFNYSQKISALLTTLRNQP